jgi:hypothetical protein
MASGFGAIGGSGAGSDASARRAGRADSAALLPAVTVGAAIVVHGIMIPEITIINGPALAQRQQTGALIHLSPGEHHGGDGAVAQAARQQSQRRQDLPSQIGRGEDEGRTVWGYALAPPHLRSGLRFAWVHGLTRGLAAQASRSLKGAVPLSEAATGRNTNIDYCETPSQASKISGARRWQSARKSLSELGRQIAVELESDAYFD